MDRHVCPWWGGYFIDNRLRRWLHNPEKILTPYVRAGMTALDFGCGMGMFTIAMARLVGETGRVISVDLQQPMLDVLARRAARGQMAQRIRVHHCEAESIGLSETQAVDFALAFYCVHEVPEPNRLLGEIQALLRPGGRLLIAEPIGHVRTDAFARTLSQAGGHGFQVEDRPRIRLSHAVVLRKPA